MDTLTETRTTFQCIFSDWPVECVGCDKAIMENKLITCWNVDFVWIAEIVGEFGILWVLVSCY